MAESLGVARVRITAELVEEMFRKGGVCKGSECIDGLPADAVLVGASFPYDINFREVVLDFSTASVREGDVQIMRPVFRLSNEAAT